MAIFCLLLFLEEEKVRWDGRPFFEKGRGSTILGFLVIANRGQHPPRKPNVSEPTTKASSEMWQGLWLVLLEAGAPA